MKNLVKYAFLNALGTAVYITLVASFIYFLGQNFADDSKSVFIPIAMLMLLVLSVAVVGSLIFGRPAMWYVDGKKKEAIRLLTYTLGIFLAVTLCAFIVLVGFI